ncbi:hypothetical protein EPUS_05578 [Endocarpon pusillum Z07020]|uniref:DUF4211 domain-containing protein n=1 Tax=Endocarpon pusillum (strain Z07020 / HMAS-L-300199) TaxID=1263415 RepID=U1GIS4_ENDPU|nr:uncharacterized protein EPUS_05578 [Endocarpon pusillum Z07020]ERF71706.1 hypothetical protein EPUS_05578 [Endocarpon pusillum Z07020]
MPRRAQTRLQFTPLPSSSPSKGDYSPGVQDRLANVRFNRADRRSLRKHTSTSIPTPEPSSQPQAEGVKGASATISQNEDEDDIESPTAKRRRTSSKMPRQTTLTPRRSARLHYQSPVHIRSVSTVSSASSQRLHSVEIPSPTPSRRTRSGNAQKVPLPSRPSPRNGTALSEFGSPETSGDDDDMIATKPATQRRRARRSPAAKDDFVVPDNTDIAPSTDGDGVPTTPLGQRTPNRINQTPRSRRLKSRREHQELEEDLQDLQDSNSSWMQSSRTRGAPVNKERERRREYIEILKRRRAGAKEPIQLDSEDEEEAGDNGYIANSIPKVSAAVFGHDQESSSEEDDIPQNPDLDSYEDDFIASEEEEAPIDRLGRPHPDIPLEFTSYASAKPRELFIHVIEWLVKNKIAPAFSRHDALWKLAFTKIKDEITAQAGSRLKSSAWTELFMNALNARPGLTTTELFQGENFLRGCDACNKAKHPAKYDFVFSGSAYHHDSLEPVDPDSSEAEAEADHDNASVDSRGHTLPPADTHFFLGRYCAANAELAHKFTHWKYNLNEDLMQYLDSQGVLSAEEIVRRERSKGGQRKREKEAEEIVDQMKATGVIDDLWKGFKADLDDARIGMEGHDRKGARGSRRIGSVRVPVSDVLRVEDDGLEKVRERDYRGTRHRDKPKMFPSDDEGE